MTCVPVLGGFHLATERVKDSAGNVIRVEAACMADKWEAMKQCYKQCIEGVSE